MRSPNTPISPIFRISPDPIILIPHTYVYRNPPVIPKQEGLRLLFIGKMNLPDRMSVL